MKIKIMWYNVLRGFHKKEKDGSFTFEKERLDAAKNIVKEINPDVLFVGEGDFNPLCEIKGPKIQTIDYQKEFNFPYVYYSEPDETSRKGEVIFSKFPIDSIKNLSIKDSTHIKSWFKISENKINIDVIHPYPTIPEKEKAKWVSEVLKTREDPYILLGDFNAFSPVDKYDWKVLVDEYELFHGDRKKAEKNAKDVVNPKMLKEVISNGLIDTFYYLHKEYSHTLPTEKYASSTNKKRTMRIDYIFCSEDFKIINSGIIKNKLTDMASDHYPIFAELEI